MDEQIERLISQLQQKWDQIYSTPSESKPLELLTKNYFLLPQSGKSLDLACGTGANALFLAEQGLESYAWDISENALNQLQHQAQKKSLQVNTLQQYISNKSFTSEFFDVIIVSRFLDRSLSHEIIDSLKPGGLLFYQTFIKEKININGSSNPNFLLDRNELLYLFQPLQVIYYRENHQVGHLAVGERDLASFIGQKTGQEHD